MKITIESTTEIVMVDIGDSRPVPARVWEGHTDTGIPVTCLMTRIAAPKVNDLSQFEKELKECRAPEIRNAWPLRLIL